MSDELKACPFCGQDTAKLVFGETQDHYKCWWISCTYCGSVFQNTPSRPKHTNKHWNTRPLEDALRAERNIQLARADKAEAEGVCLKYERDQAKSMVERLIEAGDVLSDERMSNLHSTFGTKFQALADEWNVSQHKPE